MIPEYSRWADVPDNLETKTQLGKAGFRLAKKQKPAAVKIGGYRPYDLYDVGEAVSKRKASAKQLAALEKAHQASVQARTCASCGYVESPGRRLRGKQLCGDCLWLTRNRDAAIIWARKVLDNRQAVILDTETTGLNGEPVEISVINIGEETLLDTLVQATCPVTPGARAIHNISDVELAKAPIFPDVYPKLFQIFTDASVIVIYNAQFDYGILERARRVHDLPPYPMAESSPGYDEEMFDPDDCGHWWNKTTCVMEWYASFYGEWSDYHKSFRWQPLNGGHRAMEDCQATLRRIRKMAKIKTWKEREG